MTNCSEEKKNLRREIRQRKQLVSEAEKAGLSHQLCQQVEQLPEWHTAHTILLYHALSDEVSTRELLQRWAGQKNLLLPVVDGDDLLLKPYRPQMPLSPNQWNILEPTADTESFSDYQAIDLALIPGMAFDKDGHRLGRGKGYYDRLLPRLSCPTIGICFPFQKVEKIPVEPWDIPVQRVL